jgi:drug/metabolite transporter (DMT)-like permease
MNRPSPSPSGAVHWGTIVLPPAIVRGEKLPTGRTLDVGMTSGAALGAHFGFWISSLDYTSVASVVLVFTQPVFLAILAYVLFGERTSTPSFTGIVVALAGTAVIGG